MKRTTHSFATQAVNDFKGDIIPNWSIDQRATVTEFLKWFMAQQQREYLFDYLLTALEEANQE